MSARAYSPVDRGERRAVSASVLKGGDRFGIESSYRQLKQHRIRISSRDPLFRLLFVGLALLLRNLWACCHLTTLARTPGEPHTVELSRLSLRAFVELLITQQVPIPVSTAQTGNY